jgi:hypothetical protein
LHPPAFPDTQSKLESKTKECVVVGLRWPLLDPSQNSQSQKRRISLRQAGPKCQDLAGDHKIVDQGIWDSL